MATEFTTSVLASDPHELPAASETKMSNGQGQPKKETGTVKNETDTADANGFETASPSSGSDDSLYDQILQGNVEGSFQYIEGPDYCTPDEAKRYRQMVRDLGVEEFVRQTISTGSVTAKKLCTAFEVMLPSFLEGSPDEAYYRLLGLAIQRELCKRIRLAQYKTLDDAVQLLQKSKNIVVITGAGISTSLGIPDFRSTSGGFYSELRAHGFTDPEEVFTLSNFDEDPGTFYKLAKRILPDKDDWSPTHQFIRLLQDKSILLRNYTQNIDNIESKAGIQKDKVMQCHGSWATATCRICGHKIPGEEIFPSVRAGKICTCTVCEARLKQEASQPGRKRKRVSNNGPSGGHKKRRSADSDDDIDDDIPQPGVMKPDITFFGEGLPDKFFEIFSTNDRMKADLVIVIGTSMQVAPVSEIPFHVSPEVPQIYISKDPISHIDFDINLLGYCDTVVAELCRRAGWDLNHHKVGPDDHVTADAHPTIADGGCTWIVKGDEDRRREAAVEERRRTEKEEDEVEEKK
ncbi:chromatin regulatory protein sir2 [Aulographum hederae CBS 113979]|uniref:Chromatin regulatory protein sir2 n=1 Tax=Aulographum hederae CBS 113979 TaxID=1176131 RepID=A0A6G1GK12_9PEZI|nr:chromatin regulatory protein sir2 [Aulographum hederae CBS 113979]